jgi:hypothetical protein
MVGPPFIQGEPTIMTGPDAAPRYDMYRLIHKGLRAFMADTLVAVGSIDVDDAAGTAEVLGRMRGLLAFCRSHLGHEDDFVHPAMEARAPGSSRNAALDHAEHAEAFLALEGAAAALEAAMAERRSHAFRADAAHALYGLLATFVGENLVHMGVEESHNNAVLWRTHADAELMAIEQAIVAAQAPQEQALTIRWIAAAATPAERAAFLLDIRRAAPAEAFDGILALVEAHLAPHDRAKLRRALAEGAPEGARGAA